MSVRVLPERLDQLGLLRGRHAAVPWRLTAELYAFALLAGAAAAGVDHLLRAQGPWVRAAAVVPIFGAIYLGLARVRKIPEAARLLSALRRRAT